MRLVDEKHDFLLLNNKCFRVHVDFTIYCDILFSLHTSRIFYKVFLYRSAMRIFLHLKQIKCMTVSNASSAAANAIYYRNNIAAQLKYNSG